MLRELPHLSARVENYLKAVEFRCPEWIPSRLSILPATWKKYRESLEQILLGHPRIFPDYKKGIQNFDALPNPTYHAGEFIDNWGITWKNIMEGMCGTVIKSPLENWDTLKTYAPPHPLTQPDRDTPLDWNKVKENFIQRKKGGELAQGALVHGFMYMQLYYLRGFENLMIDLATDEPRLKQLIEMVLDYNMRLIKKWIEAGVEFIYFGDDLGLQTSLPISPEKFRKYLKPCYAKMFGLCRDKRVGVYLHSDGHILEIIDDLIECGVNIINPQVRANTLEGLAKNAKGKVCINLDLDRQLFPFAKPEEIKVHIKEAVDKLYLEKGGLMLLAECAPDVPLENIEAICSIFEEIGGP